LAQTFGSGILKTENRVFAQFIKSAVRKENIYIKTDGMSVSNFCDISDCAYSVLMLATRLKGLEVFNVCNEESSTTIKGLASKINEIVNCGSKEVICQGEVPSLSNGYPANAMYKLDASKANAAGLYSIVPLRASINNATKSIVENEYE
jgi:nucleoside-diphosphate-sugar epimerase